MLIVVSVMLCGIFAGYLLREKQMKYQNQIIMALIWILLFLLGMGIGSNEQIIKQSGKLFLQAFLIASAGTLGSILAAKLLWKYRK